LHTQAEEKRVRVRCIKYVSTFEFATTAFQSYILRLFFDTVRFLATMPEDQLLMK
jgi:hypothetical protein